MFARPHLTDAPSLTVLSPEDGGEGAGGGGGGGQIPAPQPAADVTAMQARLAEYEKREQARAAADAAAEKKRLESEGNLQGLLDAERAEKAKLAADAEIGRQYLQREHARIETAKAGLTDAQKKLIDSAPNLETKALWLDEIVLNRQSGGSQVARPMAPGGSPPPGGPIDYAAAYRAGPDEWKKMKARDPKGAQAWFSAQMTTGGKNGVNRPLAFLGQPAAMTGKQ
jgi:hypothetical protein